MIVRQLQSISGLCKPTDQSFPDIFITQEREDNSLEDRDVEDRDVIEN